MPNTLLTTKLHMPRRRRVLVHRPHLMERLDDALYRKLTLVSAPAGYGKTTLLADWVVRTQTPTAWLSLDEADNDVVRFLTYLVAALQQVDQSIGIDIQAALGEAHDPPTETLLTRLINEIALAAERKRHGQQRRQQLVLVFDDYHLITAQPVHDAVNFFIDHLPLEIHVVIAGRADPPLPISRLRVRREVTEIRTPELRFSEGETAVFLNDLMGLDLSPGDITALEARTEGWIASLQLAAIALQSPLPMHGRRDQQEFVAAFSGSNRYVIDYLMDEVLSRQPENIRAFLRHTSILERFCAPLCDAVCFARSETLNASDGTAVCSASGETPNASDGTAVFFASGETPSGSDGTADRGISASRQVLRQLEKYNLFLVPLDDERHWYRYHHLFAHFLRLRLREKQPELIFELHRRASQWFEAEGLVDEAIQHALMTGDSERATRLVDQIAASLVVRRDPNRLLKLVDQLPLNLCQEYPMLCVWRAWALLFTGQLDKVEPVLQIAEAHQAKAPQFPIPGYATTVRAYVANGLGDLTKAIDLTQQALEQMSDAPPDSMTLIHQGAAVIWLGVNYRHLGDLDKARRLFVEAAPLNRKAGNIYAALAALEQLGDLALAQGRLHHAAEIFRRGLRDAKSWPDGPQRGRGTLLAATGLHLGLGTVLYQWNDLAGATHHIQRAVELDELGKAVGRVQSYRMLAYLKQAAGDYEAAYDLLAQACAIRDNLSVRQMNMAAEPSLEQLRILLSRAGPGMSHLLRDAAQRMESLGLDSDLAEATSSLDFASPATYARAAAYTDLARVLITTGRAGEANLLIERLLEAAQSMGRRGDGIRYLVLQALALHTQGDTTTALDSLNQALTLAEPEGYVRLFVDEGEPMAELLQEMASRGVANDYIEKLLAAFPPATQHSIGFAVVKPAVAQPLIEALSARELDVLRLMAARLKYKEISEQLFISLNTVRFHVKNIYGKLAVHNRAQAIDRAKALNLLKARGN